MMAAAEEKVVEACYDNPIFHEDSSKAYPAHNGSGRPTKPTPGDYAADVYDDAGVTEGHGGHGGHPGGKHLATDYMHSLPPGAARPMPCDVTYRAQQKRSRHLLVLAVVVCSLLVLAVTIGLLVHYLGEDSDPATPQPPTTSTSASPVIAVSSFQGSLIVMSGPFAKLSSQDALLLFRRAFLFKMENIFMSSSFSNVYNRTQILRIREEEGRAHVTFLVHTPPSHTVHSSDIALIGQLILAGFRDSLFVVEENSFTLKANTVAPPTTTPPPGQCQAVLFSPCVNQTTYASTSFPNLFGHNSQQEAEQSLKQFSYVYDRKCYGYQWDFFCSAFVPECGVDEQPIPPCRQYCTDIMANCEASYSDQVQQLPFSCDDLPDSTDPAVCRQNPYKPGVCVAVGKNVCSGEGFNMTAFPNVIGDVALDAVSKQKMGLMHVIQSATQCFKHTLLFTCSVFVPQCSGLPYPNHYIPPCRSLCQEYRDRCEIFMDIFNNAWPQSLNCSDLPDSPDTSVCVGYREAREPEEHVCAEGEVPCNDNRCIKKAWMCDGFQDCDDNSDEMHCASCQSNEMSCAPASSMCIDRQLGCDGAGDCYEETDEMYCVRMETSTDHEVLEVYNSVTSQWEQVCQEDWTNDLSALTCRQLGYREALTTTYVTQNDTVRKSKVVTPRNGTNLDRLQSYMDKGHSTCSSGYVVKLLCWETVCGIRPAHLVGATRIVGGAEVRPGDWPWMTSLHGGTGRRFFCGGTLIRDDWVLTAAHCVGWADRDMSSWTIMTGNTRRVAYSQFRQVRKARAVIRHPDFSDSTVENDLGLIQLDRPLAMNDYVRTICLPDKIPKPGQRCFATGWGKSKDGATRYQPAMRQVSLDVVSRDSCQEALDGLGSQVPYQFTKAMFCAGGSHSHDACQGDSGGPLVCRQENKTDQWYQGGIVSWGVACAFPNVPGIYTNLPNYVDWIQQTIANHSSRADN